jgi:hypothetical protein
MHLNTPTIIDIEASGFGTSSYPIEIGVALPNGKRQSQLIRPEPDWLHWDESAELLHGISRTTLLRHGRPVREVADVLNLLLSGQSTYSDGWVVDRPWMTTLFHAARMSMQFRLSPIEQLMTEMQMLQWDTVKLSLIDEYPATRHRASFDAWIIQQTYLRSRLATDE